MGLGTVDGKKALLLLNISEKEKTWNFSDYQFPSMGREVLIGLGSVKDSFTLPPHDAALIIADNE